MLTRRQWGLFIWILSIVLSGIFIGAATENASIGFGVSFAVLGISLGVPLMRAYTEHSN